MQSFTYLVLDPLGLHARPAGLLVKQAAQYSCDVQLQCGGKTADAKKLFATLGLGVRCGQSITVSCTGADELQACNELQVLLAANL